MKLSASRSCALGKTLPAAPKARKKNRGPVKIPRPPLLINNLQRRRYHNTFSVQTDNCVTIADLKRLISVQQNLSVLALLFRGIPLDEDTRSLSSLLPDFRIGGPVRFAVHTRVRPRAIPGGVTINVLALPRKTFQISLPSLDSTLLDLKECIQGYEGISIEQIALTHQGKQISNADHASLRICNLEPNCTVTLAGRFRGGFSSQQWAFRGHGGDLLAGEDSIAAKTCSGLESLRGGAQRGRRVLQRGLSGAPSNGHL